MISILKNKIIIAVIATVTVVTGTVIGVATYNKSESTETIQTAGIVDKKLSLEEEKIEEVKEEVISVPKEKTEEVKEEEKEEETVTYKDKTVKIPKSKVAAADSPEDAERNKKTGGEAVSQEQATNMFENVGQKSMGIDVSAHQGAINWAQVAASGVDFAMIRCGFRGQTAGTIYEDKYFKTNVTSANANGVKVGIYFYSTAVNEQEALEEAAWVVKQICTYRITYPVVYDFEDFGAYRCAGVDGAQGTKNANAFLNYVKSKGYEPMMYANKSDITTRMSRGSFSCKFWLAHYTTQTNYTGNYNMWQYTSKGSVPGIKGNVDMDIAYFSYGTTAAPKHTHEYIEVVKGSEKTSTCLVAGSKVLRCSCGETQTEEIPKLEHKFSEWKVVTEATKEQEGSKERVCSLCNTKETLKIEKISENNTTNTNTNTNSTNTTTNTVKEPDKPGAEKPSHTKHNYTEQVSKVDPTCTNEGSITYKCSECAETKVEKIEALGHKLSEKIDREATETETGIKHKECDVCHEKFEENTVIPMLPPKSAGENEENGVAE